MNARRQPLSAGLKNIVSCGRVGILYGILTSLAVFGVFLLCMSATVLLDWPADGTAGWFLEGTVAFLLFFSVLGTVFGSIAGFVFGILGTVFNRPVGWPAAGILAGALFWRLNVGLMQVFSRKPALPDLSVTYGLDLLVPLLGFVLLGLLVDRSLRTGKPWIPNQEELRRCLAAGQRHERHDPDAYH